MIGAVKTGAVLGHARFQLARFSARDFESKTLGCNYVLSSNNALPLDCAHNKPRNKEQKLLSNDAIDVGTLSGSRLPTQIIIVSCKVVLIQC